MNKQNLLSPNLLLKVECPTWYAVYTKPRSEKKVAERLQQGGIIAYCPTYTTIKQWSDRRKKVVLPVFVSYVFVIVKRSEYNLVLQDPGILNYVYHLGKAAVISERDMVRLKLFLGDLKPGELPVVRPIQAGDRVRVEVGPLAGYEGSMQDQTRRKVLILLEPLGIIVELEQAQISLVSQHQIKHFGGI